MRADTLLATIFLCFGTCLVVAQEPLKFASPADEFRALSAEWQSRFIAFGKASESAKTDEERQKAEGARPKTKEFSSRFLALARAHPNDPFAVGALVWIVMRGNVSEGVEAKAALDILIADHVDSPILAQVCVKLSSGDSKPLRALLEKNPHRIVQGYACVSLARNLLSPNPAEAEALFQRVVDQYADLKGTQRFFEESLVGSEAARGEIKGFPATLGDEARPELFALRHLTIGKAAPEIEGEDVDGKKFKLSDYRGRIVVIDFWGDW